MNLPRRGLQAQAEHLGNTVAEGIDLSVADAEGADITELDDVVEMG